MTLVPQEDKMRCPTTKTAQKQPEKCDKVSEISTWPPNPNIVGFNVH